MNEASDRRANGEHAKAAELIERHLETADPTAAIFHELGLAHAAAEHAAKAALAFRRALLLDPAFTPARDALGQANRALGIPPEIARRADQIAAAVSMDKLAAGSAIIFWSGAFLLLLRAYISARRLVIPLSVLLIFVGIAGATLSVIDDPRLIDVRKVMILDADGTPTAIKFNKSDGSCEVTMEIKTQDIIRTTRRFLKGNTTKTEIKDEVQEKVFSDR